MSLLHISQRRAIIGRKWFTFIILFEKEYKWTEEKHDGCQCGTIRYCGGNVAQLDIGMHIAESRNQYRRTTPSGILGSNPSTGVFVLF